MIPPRYPLPDHPPGPPARCVLLVQLPGDNGFRLAYIFAAPELTRQAFTCEFDHAPRLAGETDHSALVASLSCP